MTDQAVEGHTATCWSGSELFHLKRIYISTESMTLTRVITAGGPRTQSWNRNQGLGVKKVGFCNISNGSKLRRTWGCGCTYWVISTRVVQARQPCYFRAYSSLVTWLCRLITSYLKNSCPAKPRHFWIKIPKVYH